MHNLKFPFAVCFNFSDEHASPECIRRYQIRDLRQGSIVSQYASHVYRCRRELRHHRVHVRVICGLAGTEAAHNEWFWLQKLAETATNVGSGTKIGVELRFRCPKRRWRQGLGRFRAIHAASVHIHTLDLNHR